MQDSQKVLEQLITTSPLFDINKDLEPTRYRRESLKLVEHLYQYLIAQNPKKYSDFGLEIAETATNCIKNYQKERGEFLHYFNKAFSNAYRKSIQERAQSQSNGGMVVPDSETRLLRAIYAYAATIGVTNIGDFELHQISKGIGVSEERIRMALTAQQPVSVTSSTVIGDDGEEMDLIDMLPSPEDGYTHLSFIEQITSLLNLVDKEFEHCQARQKPIISAVATVRFKQIIQEYSIPTDHLHFINRDILLSASSPTQRQLANQFSRNEASISRTTNEFFRKIIDAKGEL